MNAVLSADGLYRYRLDRAWDLGMIGAYGISPPGPRLCWIMLNPSTADADHDDATIRRCIGFSQRWGFGSLVVVNLNGFRSTNPAVLRELEDPVGPDNDMHIEIAAAESAQIICAWGNSGRRGQADFTIFKLVVKQHRELFHLGLTKQGAPRHPLYLPNDVKPERWITNWDLAEQHKAKERADG